MPVDGAFFHQPHFYPRSPCGERPHIRSTLPGRPGISIHALLAESDRIVWGILPAVRYFYPRSPCGERPGTTSAKMRRWDFYPRSPCGERHFDRDQQNGDRPDFYPRSPCGERRPEYFLAWHCINISIHALLAESDVNGISLIVHISRFLSTLSLRRATCCWRCNGQSIGRFLSTLSLRRATVHYDNYNLHCVISIHALLAESDV